MNLDELEKKLNKIEEVIKYTNEEKTSKINWTNDLSKKIFHIRHLPKISRYI